MDSEKGFECIFKFPVGDFDWIGVDDNQFSGRCCCWFLSHTIGGQLLKCQEVDLLGVGLALPRGGDRRSRVMMAADKTKVVNVVEIFFG